LPSDRSKKNTVGIIGGAGYAAGELIRILLNHPDFTIDFIHSQSHAGQPVSNIHRDLTGDTMLKFSDRINPHVDIICLAQGPGETAGFLDSMQLPGPARLLDFSQDFRFAADADRSFIYGLPEANRDAVLQARYIANPGCFATAILLGLLPLAAYDILRHEVHITAVTGSTGAGQSLTETMHFSWRHANISVYKAFEHQHLHEINSQLRLMTNAPVPPLYFIPMRGNFTRGILASMYTRTDRKLPDISLIYNNYYQKAPFVLMTDTNPDLKMVINTNKCLLHLEKHGDMLLILSVIDNLIKGAAGQAVQNMNLMFGLPETTGLQLKASAF